MKKLPKRKAKGRDRRVYAVGTKLYQERRLAREERRLERKLQSPWLSLETHHVQDGIGV